MIFADLDLARRLERTEMAGGAQFIEARQRLSPDVGAQWREMAGAYAMFDGPSSPVTQTFGLGLFSEVTETGLDQVEAFFLERGAPVCHEVSPLAGVGVADLLSRRGYRPVEFTSVMYQPLLPSAELSVVSNPRLRTRLMQGGEEDLWSHVSARGWSEQVELREFLSSFGRVITETEGLFSFFAYLDEEPIATAVLRCHESVALFAGACTVPEARNQGAQGALLDARMNTARAQGCDLAMMCAHTGTTSQRNAERLGFRIAYTRTKWQLAAKE
jgi:GNAT superfamily N-acetyltransferase